MSDYSDKVKQAIDKALIEKFGYSNFEIIYGLLSPQEAFETERGPFFSPSTIAVVNVGEELDISFSVGAKGKILGDNYQITVDVIAINDEESEPLSSVKIPSEAVHESSDGMPTFGVGGNLETLTFEKSTDLILQVYVNIRDPKVIHSVNAELGDEIVKESVGLAVKAATMKIHVLGEEEDE